MGTGPGTLYMVATPIGNLQDLAPRALEVLRQVDLVAAEDTRRTRQLLAHFQVQKPLESFHGDSGPRKADKLLRRLEVGESVAYVTDGGTPGISDPGAELVAAATAAGFPVVPIPGPSALTAALSVAGLTGDRFIFAGFIPPKRLRGDVQELLGTGLPLVLYESPHRVQETGAVLAELAPERTLVVGREITKQYEEWLRGTAVEVAAQVAARETRGEYVLVLGPGPRAEASGGAGDAEAGLRRLLAAGVSVKDAAEVAAAFGALGRREAYQRALALKKEEPGPEAK